jgi:hypothetical protein
MKAVVVERDMHWQNLALTLVRYHQIAKSKKQKQMSYKRTGEAERYVVVVLSSKSLLVMGSRAFFKCSTPVGLVLCF